MSDYGATHLIRPTAVQHFKSSRKPLLSPAFPVDVPGIAGILDQGIRYAAVGAQQAVEVLRIPVADPVLGGLVECFPDARLETHHERIQFDSKCLLVTGGRVM